MKKKQFYASAACTFLACTHLCADINVRLSKTTVGLNESFVVDFSANHKVRQQPDFTPLRVDFDILSSSQNLTTKVVNGKMDVETQWHLTLQPKHQGKLIIPSITFDNEHSSRKEIEVTASHNVQQDGTLFLEVELSPPDAVYEQSQLIYTMRLYRSVNLSHGSLTPVKTDDPDTIIEQLGEDSEYESFQANGKRYIVLERKYAVFPQHSGVLNFDPIVFDGHVVLNSRSFFQQHTEFKRVTSAPQQVIVKPKPAQFQSSDWLSAYDVNLAEEWSADLDHIKVGEPITRTITITAKGCLGSQIPNLRLDFPAGVKHYQDKAEISNSPSSQGILGVKQIKFAIIGTKAEEITLPEISFPWWDLKTEQLRTLSLPAKTIQFQDSQIAINDSETKSIGDQEEILPTIDRSPEETAPLLPLWAWGLIGLNGIWVVALLRTIFRKVKRPFAAKDCQPASLRQIRKHLKEACSSNNAKLAETYLLAWAAIMFPHVKPVNFATIKPYLSEPLQEAIEQLYETLYAHQTAWQGTNLWQAFKSFKWQSNKNITGLETKDQLHRLYES